MEGVQDTKVGGSGALDEIVLRQIARRSRYQLA